MALNDEKTPAGGNRTVWSFLAIGVITLLAGLFVRIHGASPSLPKAEVLTGLFLLFGSIAALLIAG